MSDQVSGLLGNPRSDDAPDARSCEHKRLGEMRLCGLRRTSQLPNVSYWCLDCDETFTKEPA